jgi:hypothetical protein
MNTIPRRKFLRDLGISAAVLPFVGGFNSLFGESLAPTRKKRLVIMFSPNGTVQEKFWPDAIGADFQFKSVLEPLNPFKDKTLIVKGIYNKVQGDGDRHMRGMSCLLTGTELSPGNIQGGSDSPAGWASGISIDQEIKNFLQSKKDTETRFGSLEFGVAVPKRADPWTRMSYAGANKPVAPIDDPQQMLGKLYGKIQDKEGLVSVLDTVQQDLKKISTKLSAEDRALLDEHMNLVRDMESEIERQSQQKDMGHPMPQIDPTIELVNDNTPQISRMQIDLLVNSFANDMARVATLQYMRSVGEARMNWLGVSEGHHTLSHEPDNNGDAQVKLEKINTWFAGEFAYLAKKLAETPEPNGGSGSMLDNTLLVWTNELGKGNSHSLDDIPIVMLGGGADFTMGRSLHFDKVTHNRLWMAIAKSMGHDLQTFGKAELSEGGALDLA